MDAGNATQTAYLSGRSLRIILIVKPLPVIDGYDFDNDDNDFQRLFKII